MIYVYIVKQIKDIFYIFEFKNKYICSPWEGQSQGWEKDTFEFDNIWPST